MTKSPANPAPIDSLTEIAISAITVLPGRRKLDPAWVETLGTLMASQGQMTPVEVVTTDTGYRLVFGGHRLAAAHQLGWTSIRAVIKSHADFASEAEITLREISENLARRELSVLDRSVDIARWREIYEASHRLNKGGRKQSAKLALRSNAAGLKEISANSALISPDDDEVLSAKFALSFSEAAQQSFKLSRRDVFRAVKIASIPADIRDQIALHAIADNQSELLLFAAEPASRQAQIAALLTAEPPQAANVGEAIAVIDRAPKPQREERWQSVSTAFSRLREQEQNRFFALHEAAIQRWMAERDA